MIKPSLSDFLDTARHRHFVGRAAELKLFRDTLNFPELPFYVLYVYGPAGVGKSGLLQQFSQVCEQLSATPIYLDARLIEPFPNAFISGLQSAMQCSSPHLPTEVLASRSGRQVILIDTYETLLPLDNWLREAFFPQLPQNVFTVIASQDPPAPAWQSDAAWQACFRRLPLRNLEREEVRAFMRRRNIPSVQHNAVLEFTHGHPLALSLVADLIDQRPESQFHPTEAPNVIKVLVEKFVQKVPGTAHRSALEACALVHSMTESLLKEILQLPDVHEIFQWLRGLSFIESGARGVFPHDLARETLAADLQWRNPDWYGELHRRARTYYFRRLQQTSGEEQRRMLDNYIYLHRNNPVVKPFFDWQEDGAIWTDSANGDDMQILANIIQLHEGEESARLAKNWCRIYPECILILRDAQRHPAGLLFFLPLHKVKSKDAHEDPAVQTALEYLRRHAPLRPGEKATYFRFWMAKETYQSVSIVQSRIFINIVQHYLTTPGLAFTFFPCADPDFWEPMLTYANIQRLPDAEFRIGEISYGVFGQDWRRIPPETWLSLLAEKEISTSPAKFALPAAEPLIVLSESSFAKAVHKALKSINHSKELQGNPLLRSHLVMEQLPADAGDLDRMERLVSLIEEAVNSLKISPREEKLYRALYHTYLHPAGSQEQVAENLGLPYSTFRRHLKKAIDRISEILWQREIGR